MNHATSPVRRITSCLKKKIMLSLQNLSYLHPSGEVLFDKVHATANPSDRIALVGNNGSGKTTLLNLIAGRLLPGSGKVLLGAQPYYIPQVIDQFNQLTVAEALGASKKINALQDILRGEVTESNFTALDEDWAVEDRCHQALHEWGLPVLSLSQRLEGLSGGQKTKVFLAGIGVHKPRLILLDEPSNHLDGAGRQLLYAFLQNTSATLVVASHDITLLRALDAVWELRDKKLVAYGGGYDFYRKQMTLERDARQSELNSREKALTEAVAKERETLRRQQKLDARGKKKQIQAGLPTISMNTLKNKAQHSTGRTMETHARKRSALSDEVNALRLAMPGTDEINFALHQADLHDGKILFEAEAINFSYENCRLIWKSDLTFQIASGDRIALKGANGSGKSTLSRIIMGVLEPTSGTFRRAVREMVCIDQDYSFVDNTLNVFEQADKFNDAMLSEHEVKARLNRFLFPQTQWDKSCRLLSGGERLRLMLCCITMYRHPPEMIVLDEPTNNLDIQNTEILAAAIHDYTGTVVVISHDEYFLEQVKVKRIIRLS